MGGSHPKEPLYAVPVSSPGVGETAVYRNAQFKDKLIEYPKSGAKDLQQVFLDNFKNKSSKTYLGQRKFKSSSGIDPKTKRNIPVWDDHYTWLTFGEVEKICQALGSAIQNLEMAPVKQQYKSYEIKFVGIHSKNTLEWTLCDIANMIYGYTTMPLYDTLGDEAIDFMLEETELTTLFLTPEHIKYHTTALKKAKAAGKKVHLDTFVIMDEWAFTEEDRQLLDGFRYYTFNQLLEEGRKNIRPYSQVYPDDIACFSYTSGTTGLPKGAMLAHSNLVALLGGAEAFLTFLTQDTVYLSYLPLAHVFERIVFLTLSYLGANYGLYNGDVQKIKDDLAILRPTVFVSVPRLFNKFHDTIRSKTAELTGCKSSLAKRAIQTKLEGVDNGETKHFLYDKLIFSKMQQVLGGRVEYILSGSAPLSLPVKRYLKANFACPFFEGYGQTEGCAGQFCCIPSDPRMDSVGGPLPMNEFKLVDVPDMKYFSTDVDEEGRPAPRGEIWCRGKNIIPGYYKNDEKNKETITEDGWLKSGDIGMLIPGSNSLKIIDRKKNIFKLSHGEYVAPDKLEQVYKTTPGIADIFVYGDSLKSVLVAIANVDEAEAIKFAQSKGIQGSNVRELANNPEFNKAMLESLRKTCDLNKLKGFERISKLYIDPVPFADHGLITTTFKLKRTEAKEKYLSEINKLYEGLD